MEYTISRIILPAAIIVGVLFDIGRNGTLVQHFAGTPDDTIGWQIDYWSWVCAAIFLAIMPVILPDDKAKMAALCSAIFSVSAVVVCNFYQGAADVSQAESISFYEAKKIELSERLEKCDTMPRSVCVNADVEEKIKINDQKLEELISSPTLKIYETTLFGFTFNPIRSALLICLVTISLFLPYLNAAAASELRTISRAGPGFFRPDTRDEDEKTVKPKTTKKKTQPVPSKEEEEKLLSVYEVLAKKGRVTRDALARAASLGNGKAGWWLRNKKPSNIIAIGKVKHDRS